MATNLPAYRLTLYKPRSEDATETTILTPAGGSPPHSDNFVVATIQGVSGAQPYLGMPRGRQGSLDPVTRKMSTGNLSVTIDDLRTTVGGGNASRWGTAFIGDASGRSRLKGCKAVLERSLNAGGTWAPYFAGRVRDVALDGALKLSLDLRDSADDLNRLAFVGTPHPSITNAAMASLLPVGVPIAFGSIAASPLLRGTLETQYPYNDTVNGALVVLQSGKLIFDVTQDAALALMTKVFKDYSYEGAARRVVATIPGIGTVNLAWPARFVRPELPIPGVGTYATHYRPQLIYVETIPTDPASSIPPTLGTQTAITFYITQDLPPSKDLPLLINDVHPVQLMADLIDGKYSLSPGATTLRALGMRDTSGGGPWATLLADLSFGTCRFIIDKSWKANDFMEQCLCLPYGLALTIDASGQVKPIDLRRQTSVTLAATLTDADVVANEEPSWADSRDGAITAVEYHYFTDRALARVELDALPETYPALPPTLLQTTDGIVFELNDLSTLRDVGEKIVKVTAIGTRIVSGEVDSAGQSAVSQFTGKIRSAIDDFLAPFQTGTLKFKVPYLVSSSAGNVAVGDFVSANHSKMPNPATNQRGGARLGLVVGRSEQGGTVSLEMLDYGASTSAAVPSITSVAVGAHDPNAVDVVIAANAAGDQVAIWAAVTNTSVGTRPAVTAASWRLVRKITGSGTARTGSFPRGSRVWLRARSQAIGASASAPSSWVYPTPGYIDLSALAACSGLAASGIFANRADLIWANGDSTLDVEVFLTPGSVPGTWTSAMFLRTYAPGTTSARVGDLATSTAYAVGVRVRDESGGGGPMATATFTTTGTRGVAPTPTEFAVVIGALA